MLMMNSYDRFADIEHLFESHRPNIVRGELISRDSSFAETIERCRALHPGSLAIDFYQRSKQPMHSPCIRDEFAHGYSIMTNHFMSNVDVWCRFWRNSFRFGSSGSALLIFDATRSHVKHDRSRVRRKWMFNMELNDIE